MFDWLHQWNHPSLWKFLITDLISLIGIRLFRFSISCWFSLILVNCVFQGIYSFNLSHWMYWPQSCFWYSLILSMLIRARVMFPFFITDIVDLCFLCPSVPSPHPHCISLFMGLSLLLIFPGNHFCFFFPLLFFHFLVCLFLPLPLLYPSLYLN